MWQKKQVQLPDSRIADGVVLVNPVTGDPYAAGVGIDRELVVTTYRCKTAFTGASVGDTITATQVIDVSGAPNTVSTIWRNQTTAADLAGAPSAANLEIVGSTALTDAQLRASAVPVTVGNFPASQPVTGPLTDTQLRASRVPVTSSVPAASSVTILSATTASSGTGWTAFASQACTALDIVNNTNTTIEYRRGGAGVAMQVPVGAARMVIGITNASQIDIRRTDTSATQVTVQAEAIA